VENTVVKSKKKVLSYKWELARDCSCNLWPSIIDATQREQWLGSAWNWRVNKDVQPNTITPEWIYNANTKGPWSKARGLGIGGLVWAWRVSSVWIRLSNPPNKMADTSQECLARGTVKLWLVREYSQQIKLYNLLFPRSEIRRTSGNVKKWQWTRQLFCDANRP